MSVEATEERPCPVCKEMINADTLRCVHCGTGGVAFIAPMTPEKGWKTTGNRRQNAIPGRRTIWNKASSAASAIIGPVTAN